MERKRPSASKHIELTNQTFREAMVCEKKLLWVSLGFCLVAFLFLGKKKDKAGETLWDRDGRAVVAAFQLF